jgi:septal ring factor EnvC (AmiA/AmiB activator)
MLEFNEVYQLDEAINRAFDSLSTVEPGSEDYTNIVDQLVKLGKIKENISSQQVKALEVDNKRKDAFEALGQKTEQWNSELSHKERELDQKMAEAENTFALKKRELDDRREADAKPDRLSKDTLAIVAGNIAGIMLIIGYERVNVIASKALAFVMKSR